jgi:hypothetical protein
MAATVWIAYSTKQLRDFAEQQAKDMKESLKMTEGAITVGNRQAAAAEAANDHMRETAKHQLRAYVVQTNVDTNNALTSGQETVVHLKNVGQTPAINMGFGFAVKVATPTGDIKPPFEFSLVRDATAPVEMLGAGIETSERIINAPISDRDLDSLRKKKSILIVWGAFWYDDIFGNAHYTRFCKSFENADFAHWNTCASHNDAS